MRRFVTLTLAVLLSCLCISAQETASGQLKDFRNTPPPPRKDGLKTVSAKILKVVVANDNTPADGLIQDAVENGWYISPFEFITIEQFEKEKTDSSMFFLIRADRNSGWKEDSGLEYLSFRKGDPDATEDLSEMEEIITLPLSPVDDEEGRALSYIPSYIAIIQRHIEKVMEKNINAYLGMSVYNDIFSSGSYSTALFRESDFAINITEEKLSNDSKGKAKFASDEEIEEMLENPAEGTIVSLVVQPNPPTVGSSFAYQMLICPYSGELVYYHKHKISKTKGAGFSKIEYMSILKYFK